MKLAVPEHRGRIAPVFDCCRRLMIVLQDFRGEEQLSDEDWATIPKPYRAARLVQLEVELLVCGGISCWMENEIRRRGIRLIPWIAGDVWEVLVALRDGRISDPCYAMPGRAECAARNRNKKCYRSGPLQRTISREEQNNA